MCKYLINNSAYQPSFQFPLNFVYEDSIPEDDISRTVKEIVEGVNVFKFINFSHRNSYGYDGIESYINKTTLAKKIIESDGPENEIASYDGVEREERIDGTTYYIYRRN